MGKRASGVETLGDPRSREAAGAARSGAGPGARPPPTRPAPREPSAPSIVEPRSCHAAGEPRPRSRPTPAGDPQTRAGSPGRVRALPAPTAASCGRALGDPGCRLPAAAPAAHRLSRPLPLGQHAAGAGPGRRGRQKGREDRPGSRLSGGACMTRGASRPRETIAAAAGERWGSHLPEPRRTAAAEARPGRGQGGQPQAAFQPAAPGARRRAGPGPAACPSRSGSPASPAFALGEEKARRRVVLRQPRGPRSPLPTRVRVFADGRYLPLLGPLCCVPDECPIILLEMTEFWGPGMGGWVPPHH